MTYYKLSHLDEFSVRMVLAYSIFILWVVGVEKISAIIQVFLIR